jgi:hypothetical protein
MAEEDIEFPTVPAPEPEKVKQLVENDLNERDTE